MDSPYYRRLLPEYCSTARLDLHRVDGQLIRGNSLHIPIPCGLYRLLH